MHPSHTHAHTHLHGRGENGCLWPQTPHSAASPLHKALQTVSKAHLGWHHSLPKGHNDDERRCCRCCSGQTYVDDIVILLEIYPHILYIAELADLYRAEKSGYLRPSCSCIVVHCNVKCTWASGKARWKSKLLFLLLTVYFPKESMLGIASRWVGWWWRLQRLSHLYVYLFMIYWWHTLHIL